MLTFEKLARKRLKITFYKMEKLDLILNRISRNKKSFQKLQKKVKGVFLGTQLYLIEEHLYDVDFVFEIRFVVRLATSDLQRLVA